MGQAGGGMRCDMLLGTFPRDDSSSKVGLAACWGILSLSVLLAQILEDATALGADAMHRLSIMGGSSQESSRGASIITVCVAGALNDPN